MMLETNQCTPRRLFIFLLVCAPFFGTSQQSYVFVNVGMGFSGISPIAISGSVSFERKNNEITLSGDLTRQFFNTEIDRYRKYYYNDSYGQYALLYGRTYRKFKGHMLALSVGPSKYTYMNKTLITEIDPNCTLRCEPYYSVDEKFYQGIGLTTQFEAQFIKTENFGVGLRCSMNFTPYNTFYLFSFNFVAGALKVNQPQ